MSSKTARDRASLCTATFADGRQCRMPWKNKSTRLCHFHSQHAEFLQTAIQAGETIASCMFSDFVTDCSLTAALSGLFISVARGEYDLKTARTLGYIAQVMSKSMGGAKSEFDLSIGHENMRRVVEYCLSRVHEDFRRPDRRPAALRAKEEDSGSPINEHPQ